VFAPILHFSGEAPVIAIQVEFVAESVQKSLSIDEAKEPSKAILFA